MRRAGQPDDPPPSVVDAEADSQFRAACLRHGTDPDDRWVGGYAAYEWEHLRKLLVANGLAVSGRSVLEIGCNVGGSSIVLAALGAEVSAIDIDVNVVEVAAANVARHGLHAAIQRVGPGELLPFAEASFDLVLCNSVLEYVADADLPGVVAEIGRVLKVGGDLLIVGTASRLAPREVHSGRWLVNYVPRAFDRLTGREFQRGLSPLRLRRLLGDRFRNRDLDDSGAGWLAARTAMSGGRESTAARGLATVARLLGVGPGWLTPNISAVMRKLR